MAPIIWASGLGRGLGWDEPPVGIAGDIAVGIVGVGGLVVAAAAEAPLGALGLAPKEVIIACNSWKETAFLKGFTAGGEIVNAGAATVGVEGAAAVLVTGGAGIGAVGAGVAVPRA